MRGVDHHFGSNAIFISSNVAPIAELSREANGAITSETSGKKRKHHSNRSFTQSAHAQRDKWGGVNKPDGEYYRRFTGSVSFPCTAYDLLKQCRVRYGILFFLFLFSPDGMIAYVCGFCVLQWLLAGPVWSCLVHLLLSTAPARDVGHQIKITPVFD